MKKLLFLLCTVFAAACSSIDCPVDNTVAAVYHIYNRDENELKLGDVMTVTTVRRDGTDSTLFNQGTGISEFSLPVSYSHAEDVLVFHFTNEERKLDVKDTVWIEKEDIPHFESVDCNAIFFHNLTAVRHTQHYIQSIVINNPSVTYDKNVVHFRLYPAGSN